VEDHPDDLVRRARTGDLDAYAVLLEEHSPRLSGLLRGHIPARLRAKVDVEDLVQSTFREAIEQFPRFELRNPAALGRYLSVVAERRLGHAVARFRAQRRAVEREAPLQPANDSGTWGGSDPPANGPGPATNAQASEARQRIRSCLDQMPEDHRTVLLLEMAGCDGGEIARILEKPESTIRTWRGKARHAVHRQLRSLTSDPG
jgi:RNA polymerase sigma factor (sigma-70 family)